MPVHIIIHFINYDVWDIATQNDGVGLPWEIIHELIPLHL